MEPEEKKRAIVTEILAALGTLRKLHIEHDEALHLHQQAIEAWGVRLQALEKQVAEIIRVLQAPGPPPHIGSVN